MHSVKKAAFWSYSSFFINQFLTFIISVVLARLLTPEIFGIMGMALIVTQVGITVKGLGLRAGIIQDQNLNQKSYSSLFYLQVFAGLFVSALVFLTSPFIANFFNEPRLIEVLKIICFIILFDSIDEIPRNRISKELKFQSLVIAEFTSMTISGAIGIIMALKGYGIWSLVSYQISKTLFRIPVIFIVTRWIPSFYFRMAEIKKILPFSMSIYGSEILTAILQQLNKIVLGKFMPAAQLGLYNKGLFFKKKSEDIIYQGIQQVTFPLFSKHQNNNIQLITYVNKMQKLISFALVPAMLFIFVLAEPLVLTILGEQWVGSIVIVQYLSISGIIGKISNVNVGIIKAKGHSKLLFNFKLIDGLLSLILLIFAIKLGFDYFLGFIVLRVYIVSFFRFYFGQKLIGLSVISQIRNILPYFLNSAFIGLITFLLLKLTNLERPIVNLIIGSLFATASYLMMCYFQKLEAFEYFVKNTKNFISKR